ncbi:MAG: hydrogenase maturation nickel metallochaperone HypA [Campylobacter sp.]|uniref:hydrogenase maturation nickel metallochaperone HypA n=1 Tax=Campylobacter sp. TaxID=205 RepID=UPI0029794547|nr:hydrogenase maturation nickel metallochaperone HypA [Campylobacter sp.]MDD7599841.1 hydrogenase maturation nickel metallochaperone HypA [Campylobacteraceae bacterium]MDY5887717.1 hydrogenase maturation nickel metallochaperone HypA [Campylobacter sp.]
MHELSIVQDLLKVCDTNATEQGASSVKRVEIQDIIVRCCQCGREGTIMANEFVCPMCGSRELVVTKGEDLILMRLELEK